MDRKRGGFACAPFVVCGAVLVTILPLSALAQATSTATTTIEIASSTATTTQAAIASSSTKMTIEDKVRIAFADAPIMVDVARCKSHFKQFTQSGKIFYGGTHNGMVGIFQLYAKIHSKIAAKLGFNISTIDGNIGYAHYLYKEQGTDPWLDSFKCWEPTTTPESLASTTPIVALSDVVGVSASKLTKDLSLGKTDPQVLTLQKMLNAMGFAVADSGPGSPGHETKKYGTGTREAVRSFQCKQGIACDGSEGTTGYGFVGARTRAALLIAYATSTSSPEVTEKGRVEAMR